jgi:membrane protease YdiL (CAAX protease family)
MKEKPKGMRRVWFILAFPPILFLIVIVAVSIYFGIITQGDAQAIAESVPRATPYILLIVQVILLLIFLRTIRADGLAFRDIGWQLPVGQKLWQEVLIGVLIGVPLGFLYIFVLSPLLATVQRVIGDYVPPEQLLSSLGSTIIPFFIANVVLAPFVEENIYRGYAIKRLRQRFSVSGAFFLSCLFFGLLHWAGGFWYIILTGVVAGGAFAGLFMWRRNLVVAYTAHLALNLVEFLLVWLMR